MGIGPSLSEENESAKTFVRVDTIYFDWAFVKVLIKNLCKALPNPCDATDFIIGDAFLFLSSLWNQFPLRDFKKIPKVWDIKQDHIMKWW